MAKLGVSDCRQRVAPAENDSRCRAEGGGYRGQEDLRACLDAVGVNDSWIDGKDVVPAEALA